MDIVDSPAGMHVVVWLHDYDKQRADALIALAQSRGLGIYGMAPHYLAPPARQGLLMGYCGLSTGELREAIRIFGNCLDDIGAGRAENMDIPRP